MNVLITGAGRGIGKAIALAIAGAGHAVALTSRTIKELEEVQNTIHASGGKAYIYSCDITDRNAIGELVQKVQSELGTIDILINNAGIAESAKLEDTTDDFWHRTFAINVDAPFLLSRALVPGMKRSGKGRIINIASTAALEGFNYTSAYTASKHALLGLARALSVELRKSNITVHTICPGFVRTDILTKGIKNITDRTGKTPEEAEAQLSKMNVSGKIIEPEEVADIALQIISGANTSELVVL
jgi:NAD(P)-dependent dehydrogenase (short-subunit alcohol dehydrogenase family)